MADWPDTEELAQVLNVANVDDWDTTLDRVLASAIAQVKEDVGNWDEDEDDPDDKLAQAALRLAELLSQRPDATIESLTADASYRLLLKGRRQVFGVA